MNLNRETLIQRIATTGEEERNFLSLAHIRARQFKETLKMERRVFLRWGLGMALIFSSRGKAVAGEKTAQSVDNSAQPREKEAEAFYAQVDFRIDEITKTSARIVATAPSDMFCPFTYGKDKTYGQMKFMDMVSPGKDHLIYLTDLEPSTTYYLQINSVLSNLRIYKSRVVNFTTAPNARGVKSLQEGEGRARLADMRNAAKILTLEPEVAQVKSNYALIKYTSFKPTFSAVGFGTDSEYGLLKRMSVFKPSFDHEVQLVGLKQQSAYRSRALMVDRGGNVYATNDVSFTTPERKGYVPEGANVALLSVGARVTGVASEWGPGFVGQMAINGDGGREWASDGDGDDAWIEITLAKPETIHALGYWTRTMGSSALTTKFKVIADGGKAFGPFNLRDATQPYYFKIPPTRTQKLRFEVVESNGGKTGAISVEAYAK